MNYETIAFKTFANLPTGLDKYSANSNGKELSLHPIGLFALRG